MAPVEQGEVVSEASSHAPSKWRPHALSIEKASSCDTSLARCLCESSPRSCSSPSSDGESSGEGASSNCDGTFFEGERGYPARAVRTLREIQVAPCLREPETKTPQTSKSHIDVWSMSSETIIMLDWDDTLFPTTQICKDPQLESDEVDLETCSMDQAIDCLAKAVRKDQTTLEMLEKHQSAVIALLRVAVTLGRVVIVTLAKTGWVEKSCRNFMPKVGDVLKELGIEVVYAREAIPPHYLQKAQEDKVQLDKVLKTRAMSRVIKKFYGNGNRGRSWKNVISIGDSAAERLAVQDVIIKRVQRDSRGAAKECRCKVVKLLTEPSFERLTLEVEVLISWLLTIVYQDDDVDIDFSEMLENEEDKDSRHGSKSSSWSSCSES